MLNETPLQHSTASIGDTENVEVEDNDINIGIDEHEVRQEEELREENEAACVTEAIVNVEGMDVVTTNKGTRQVHAEERLVLKRLREIFETKVHHDIPSVKNVGSKNTKREVKLVNSATTNVKINSESKDNKFLGSAAFLVAEMLGVMKRQKS